ncbi:MAG: molecular chaperone DnaK [Nitrospinota bacterium]|nr:molecular chaperone DnaK [Nitrospinota bacterium]
MNDIIGIDLGTTNSLVAFVENNDPFIVSPDGESNIFPSVVSFFNDRVLCGDEALESRKTNSRCTVFSVKRFMGKGFDDVKNELTFIPFEIDANEKEVVHVKAMGRSYSGPEISSIILRSLKSRAEKSLGRTFTRAVITVPAYFNDSERQATKDAGRLAGLDVLRILNEPTAASLAYGLHEKNRGTIAVYDLGGGTFDISILRVKNGVFEVLSTGGDTHLGGDDFDRSLSELLNEKVKKTYSVDLYDTPEGISKLILLAEETKVSFSNMKINSKIVIIDNLPSINEQYEIKITREEIELIFAPIIQRTLHACEKVLADGNLAKKDINELILVGGSTRMPIVKNAAEKFFEIKSHSDINPDEVVALGAAVQGQILSGDRKDMLLLDVTPLSLGIETMGGTMGWILPRNTTIPANAKEMYTTSEDNQTGVDIHVLQGERELVKDNRSLSRFHLKIDPVAAGIPRIEVTFLIDANGILNVTARDLRSGKATTIEVQPSYGLTDEKVENILLESFEFAEEDIHIRQLLESKNEAHIILVATIRALDNLGKIKITKEEINKIKDAISDLEKECKGNDPNAIREKIDLLNKITMPFADQIMGDVLKSALENKKLSEALRD